MGDIFQLFDGKFGAGGASSVTEQVGTSFSEVSPENDLVARLASGSDGVDLLIDYSDFSNFVTFNSAQSYVTVTADQVLNEYPAGGSVDDLQAFLDSLDGYQRYFLANWPARIGHLRLNPAVSSSYVSFTDFGVQDGAAKTSFISAGTGSLSIQGWVDVPVLTGSNDVLVVFQKRPSAAASLTVYLSASSVYFDVVSGSTQTTLSGVIGTGPQFFAGVIDRTASTGSLSLYVATTGTFPTLSDSSTAVYGTRFDMGSGSFFIGSGSVTGKVVRPFTGSLDDVSVWSSARGRSALTGTFNRKLYAQPGLIAGWRFNEATVRSPASYASIARDVSGHRLDGRIARYFSGSRGSGSLAYDSPDPILSLEDPDVVYYVVSNQVTGSTYDRGNGSLIFNLFPEAFTLQDESLAFQNFGLIMARHFDRVKLYVSQLANLRRVGYGDFDQAPDELLEEVGRYFGWQLDGSFATTDALRYFVGRNVAPGPAGNHPLDTQLSDIKAQFWRRILLNLMYLYKGKGTRESVEALLRTYGVDNGFVRLKEYARKTETRVPTARVETEKSVYSMAFSRGRTVSLVTDGPAAALGVTADATSGKLIPQNSSEWTNLMALASLVGGNPRSLWKCQEAAGNLVDSIGTVTLTAAGGPGYQGVVPGWTSKAVTWVDAQTMQFANTTTAPDPMTTSIAFMVYARHTSIPGSRRFFAAVSGLAISLDVIASAHAEVGDAGQGVGTEVVTDGVVRPYILALNITAGTCKMYTPFEIVSTGFYNGAGSTIGTALGAIAGTTPDGGVVYAAEWSGLAAEFSDANVRSLLQALGWTVAW